VLPFHLEAWRSCGEDVVTGEAGRPSCMPCDWQELEAAEGQGMAVGRVKNGIKDGEDPYCAQLRLPLLPVLSFSSHLIHRTTTTGQFPCSPAVAEGPSLPRSAPDLPLQVCPARSAEAALHAKAVDTPDGTWNRAC
jgi:hypothetical protein